MIDNFKQKLTALTAEAKELRLPAVHVALHLLLGAHTNNTQAAFARHCCAFSLGGMRLGGDLMVEQDKFPAELPPVQED